MKNSKLISLLDIGTVSRIGTLRGMFLRLLWGWLLWDGSENGRVETPLGILDIFELNSSFLLCIGVRFRSRLLLSCGMWCLVLWDGGSGSVKNSWFSGFNGLLVRLAPRVGKVAESVGTLLSSLLEKSIYF